MTLYDTTALCSFTENEAFFHLFGNSRSSYSNIVPAWASAGIFFMEEKAGLAHLLSAVMTKGCDGLSSLEIAEKVESVGASLGTDAATDYFVLSLKTVTADFIDILTLAGQLLRSPTFPENQVELEKRLAIQDIRSQKEQPFSQAFEQLRQVMYPNHPYSMSVLGDETQNWINPILGFSILEGPPAE